MQAAQRTRSNKTLGSLLCTEKDISRRRVLAQAAFDEYKKVWITGKKISLKGAGGGLL